jgi:hypothetical protein
MADQENIIAPTNNGETSGPKEAPHEEPAAQPVTFDTSLLIRTILNPNVPNLALSKARKRLLGGRLARRI